MFIYRTCRVDWIVRPTYIAPWRGLQVDAMWSVANYARNTLANPWVLSHAWHNTQDLWFKPGSSFLRMQMRMRYEFQRHKFTTNCWAMFNSCKKVHFKNRRISPEDEQSILFETWRPYGSFQSQHSLKKETSPGCTRKLLLFIVYSYPSHHAKLQTSLRPHNIFPVL